ncbi:hypothetical protein HY024_05025 [Candidatus Curtissbacteria bacterium]|nr:hypothetical protein [Candidatus Curtissbacteria bacterium]
MGGFGGFYKGEKKKQRKEQMEKKASTFGQFYTPPKVEIVGKKGKKIY